MSLSNFFRRRHRSGAVTMLLVDPRQCVQGLQRLGKARAAERAPSEAVRASLANEARSILPGANRRPQGAAPVIRPRAK